MNELNSMKKVEAIVAGTGRLLSVFRKLILKLDGALASLGLLQDKSRVRVEELNSEIESEAFAQNRIDEEMVKINATMGKFKELMGE